MQTGGNQSATGKVDKSDLSVSAAELNVMYNSEYTSEEFIGDLYWGLTEVGF